MEHRKIRQDGDTLYLNFGEYGGSVDVAAVSGDGNRALLVREVGVARVWDFTRERWVAEIAPTSPLTGRTGVGPTTRPFEVFVESAALDRRGELALLGLNDRTAVLVRVDTGETVAVLADPEISAPEWGVVRAVAFSPDDRLALVGLLGRRVGVWAADGTFVAVHRGALGDRLVTSPFPRPTLVTSVAASRDGRRVFAGAADMTASVFELESGREVWSAGGHPEELLGVEQESFPPRDLFEWHRVENVAALWRTPWGSFLHQSDGPRGWVRPLAWSEPGDLVVVGGAGKAVVLRATAEGAELAQELPFADRLRVGRVAGDHVVLVGCGGEVARRPLVDPRG